MNHRPYSINPRPHISNFIPVIYNQLSEKHYLSNEEEDEEGNYYH